MRTVIHAGICSIALSLVACADNSAPVGLDPDEGGSDGKADGTLAQLRDVQCADEPDAGPSHHLRHILHYVVTELGDPHHRGIDLVADAADTEQTIAGEISYGGLVDKALEDEDVDVFACRAGAWKPIGTARTDDEGRFELTLSGSDRLPIGMRDMFVSVRGDRTGARFLAVVAPGTTQLAVSDVDGTLTTSENAFIADQFGIDADIHPGAATGWTHVRNKGFVPVYVTARPRVFTGDTRTWLAAKGMPRGALRLSDSLMLPGSATVTYKTDVLNGLAAELPLAVGVGNRASDIEAYTNAGIDADHIFIKLPEFADELKAHLNAGEAIGFPTYPGPLSSL